jgi:hypothetical protein
MPDTTDVSRARTKLYDALTSAALAPWRVHRVTPAQIVAPCVYLDSVELGPSSVEGAAILVASFPIVLVADGLERRQVEELDDILAHVWTAVVAAGGDPGTSRPVSLDVGGPNLRAHVVPAGMLVTAFTLCAPTLVSAGGNGRAI